MTLTAEKLPFSPKTCSVCGKKIEEGDWCAKCLREADKEEMQRRHADEKHGIQYERWAE